MVRTQAKREFGVVTTPLQSDVVALSGMTRMSIPNKFGLSRQLVTASMQFVSWSCQAALSPSGRSLEQLNSHTSVRNSRTHSHTPALVALLVSEQPSEPFVVALESRMVAFLAEHKCAGFKDSLCSAHFRTKRISTCK